MGQFFQTHSENHRCLSIASMNNDDDDDDHHHHHRHHPHHHPVITINKPLPSSSL